MKKKKILLIITGSIASYKSLTLIRLLKDLDIIVNCVLTKSAENFVTPLSVSSLAGTKVYDDLFCLDDELEMGHIKLAKENDLIVVAPATANFVSKVANGLADDLASTILLATNTPSFIFPAMNPSMLKNYFIKKNLLLLKEAGIKVFNTNSGELACGDLGFGRMKEPEEIVQIIKTYLFKKNSIFKGINALVTAGPTQELIDPVRFISNNSSGKQGYAIAEQLADMGANVCLVSGPTKIAKPSNVNKFIEVQTADHMFEVCSKNIPNDLFISVAAVADWKVKSFNKNKLKKNSSDISFKLTENKDILKFISTHSKRPKLVVGFAAETKDLKKNSVIKLKKKKCDLIVANDVSLKNNNIGGNKNSVHIYDYKNCLAKYLNMDKNMISHKILTEVIYPIFKKKNTISLASKTE